MLVCQSFLHSCVSCNMMTFRGAFLIQWWYRNYFSNAEALKKPTKSKKKRLISTMIFYRILPNLHLDVIEIGVGLYVEKFVLKLMICKIFVCEEFLSPSVSALIQSLSIFNAQLVLYCSLLNSGSGFQERAYWECCGCTFLRTLKCLSVFSWKLLE